MDAYGRTAAWLAGAIGVFFAWTALSQVPMLSDPCHAWGTGGTHTVQPGGPCGSGSASSGSRAQFVERLLLYHGVPALASAVAVWGALRGKRLAVAVGALVLLVASCYLLLMTPIVFLMVGGAAIACLVLAWKMPRSPAPSPGA